MAATNAADHVNKHHHKDGGFHFNDEEDIKKQRRAIWDFIKNIGASVFEGKDLVSVSLPVYIFEPRSFLERLTDNWVYLPHFLSLASEAQDPVERLEYVIALVISGLHNTCTAAKPFNPILGETYEATYENGTQVMCEQTSHHPPVSHWEVIGPNSSYRYTGYGGWAASFRGNAVKGQFIGPNKIEFYQGLQGCVEFDLPYFFLRGVMWGDRVMEYAGDITFVDKANNLKCTVIFNPDEKGFFKSFFSRQKSPTDTIKGEIVNGEGKVVSTLFGSWLRQVESTDCSGNKKVLWELSKLSPMVARPVDNPLPSDCRYREDLQALKAGDIEGAQRWKVKLEEKQRAEAKLRKEHSKKHHRK